MILLNLVALVFESAGPDLALDLVEFDPLHPEQTTRPFEDSWPAQTHQPGQKEPLAAEMASHSVDLEIY